MKYKLRNENVDTNPSTALQSILKQRGVKELYGFMNPTKERCEYSALDLKNSYIAAQVLLEHLRKNSNILFIVDQDADGFTSSSILWLYIKRVFPDANLSFTVHEHKQHGIEDKIDWIEELEDLDLVIVPDAGSYDIEEHRRLNEKGIACIVLDHHEQLYDDNGNPVVSNASNTIIVNNQLSPNYPNKSLCGAGVVYKFCEILDGILGVDYAYDYLDLAALGEIADVMDRTDIETNYIMTQGLKNIKNKGIRTLLEAQSFTLKEKAVYPYPNLTPIDVAFYIAPTINAITRIGSMTEKENMFYCFIDPDRPVQSTKRGAKPGDTETAAEATARCGNNAKTRQNNIKAKALELMDFKIQKDGLDDNNIIVIEIEPQDKIPQELTGLIAMGVVSKYHKPCMIGRRNSNNELQGSIRSDGNFNGLPSFKQFLENSGLITYAAGHDNACGFGISGNKIDKLIDYANKMLNPEDFENCYIVDYILDGSQDNNDLLYALASHPEYFGNHIEEIKVVVKNISLSNILLMGANKDSVKISYNKVDYVKFKDEDFIEDITRDRSKTLTVYGRININEFMGRTSIQLFIDDYELMGDTSKYDF